MAISPSFASPLKRELSHLLRLGRLLVPYRWRIAVALCALVVAASCVVVLAVATWTRFCLMLSVGERTRCS